MLADALGVSNDKHHEQIHRLLNVWWARDKIHNFLTFFQSNDTIKCGIDSLL